MVVFCLTLSKSVSVYESNQMITLRDIFFRSLMVCNYISETTIRDQKIFFYLNRKFCFAIYFFRVIYDEPRNVGLLILIQYSKSMICFVVILTDIYHK